MSKGQNAKGGGYAFSDVELAWIGEHLTDLQRSAVDQRFLRWSLAIGFVVGLAAHVGGYALRSSGMREPFLLVADLLYALGWSLWTGVVVAVFVQLIPEAKQRQIKRALEAYELARRDEASAGSGRPSSGVDSPSP